MFHCNYCFPRCQWFCKNNPHVNKSHARFENQGVKNCYLGEDTPSPNASHQLASWPPPAGLPPPIPLPPPPSPTSHPIPCHHMHHIICFRESFGFPFEPSNDFDGISDIAKLNEKKKHRHRQNATSYYNLFFDCDLTYLASITN